MSSNTRTLIELVHGKELFLSQERWGHITFNGYVL